MEVLLSGAIFALFATVLISAIIYGQETARVTGAHARAAYIAEEGLEAIRNIRDGAYTNLNDGTYGLTLVNNQWTLLGSNNVTGEFTRQVAISTIDTKTKKTVVTVTWPQNLQRTGTITLISYFTNWMALGIGSWASPLQEAVVDISGNQDAVKVQTVGNYAYILRNSGSPNFIIVDITNPSNPVVTGSLTLSGNPVNIAVENNIAYFSSDNNAAELQIVSLANPASPTLLGTYNAPGNANAAGIAVVSSTVYLGRTSSGDHEFYIVNATNPASPTLAGSLNLSDTVNDIVVNGLYAYLASNSNSSETQVISLLNPALPSLAGSYNITGNTDALSLAIKNSTTLIVGAANNTLYSLNISTPTSPTLYGSLGVGGRISDISLGNANNYAFIATGLSSAEFQVIDITNASIPSVLGSLNLSSPITGIAYSSSLDRAILASSGNSEEVIIVKPQ